MKTYFLIFIVLLAAFAAVFFEGKRIEKEKCVSDNQAQQIKVQKNVIKAKVDQSKINVSTDDASLDLWLQRINEERDN